MAEIVKYSGDGSKTKNLNLVMNSIEDQNDLEISRIRRIADSYRLKITEKVQHEFQIEENKAFEDKQKKYLKNKKRSKTERQLALLK